MKYIQLNKGKREIRLGLLCIMVCMVFFGCGRTSTAYFEEEEDSSSEAVDCEEEQGTDGTVELQEDTEKIERLCVFVCGCVQSPGVYELPEESRIVDAVNAAGGMTDQACTDYWNLAERLEDGQKIYVPSRKEVAQDEVVLQNADRGLSQSDTMETEDKININTADETQLMKLSGIGESRAKGIVSYRLEHGNFSSIEEIKNVSGIGEAIFSRMKDKITV